MTSTEFTVRDSRNHRTFSLWMIATMILFAAATILIDGKWIPPAAGWALTAVTGVLLVVTIHSYMYFLRHADELLRKVHLEALALAFGAGVVVMMVYRLCERLGAPQLDINDPLLVMCLTWIGGQVIGSRRYAAGEGDE